MNKYETLKVFFVKEVSSSFGKVICISGYAWNARFLSITTSSRTFITQIYFSYWLVNLKVIFHT